MSRDHQQLILKTTAEQSSSGASLSTHVAAGTHKRDTESGLPRGGWGGRLCPHSHTPAGARLEPVQGMLTCAHTHPHWGPHVLSTSACVKGTPPALTTHTDTCPLTGHTEEQTAHGVTYLRRTLR